MFRIGMGQDSHRFAADPARPLLLGGVRVADARGLDGNSDADVVLHALCAQGVADSREYVKVARSRVEAAGWRVNNVGLTIEARTPKIEPLRVAMKQSVATLVGISPDAVGINATSGEGMTPFGKGEGIQAFAIVSLVSALDPD